MRQKRTDGYGERLRRALHEGPKPMSIRQLGATMAERFPDMRGATYGGVRQYAAGNIANPRMELLRALADVLAVREDWLAHGEGEMTERAERVAKAGLEAAASERNLAVDAISAINAAALEGFGPRSEHLKSTDLATLVMLTIPSDHMLSEQVEAGRRIGDAIASLLRALWVDPTKIEPYECYDIFQLATLALRRVINHSDPPAHVLGPLTRPTAELLISTGSAENVEEA